MRDDTVLSKLGQMKSRTTVVECLINNVYHSSHIVKELEPALLALL
jgi:hypothetical protein